jgi:adenylyltransferase/sulfurtransferase
MGVLQALEAIKVLTGVGDTLARKLLIFDALSGHFRTVRLRGRAPGCAACGPGASIGAGSIAGYDYLGFTGQAASDGPPPALRVLRPEERLSPQQLQVGRLQLGAPCCRVRCCEPAPGCIAVRTACLPP